MVDSFIVSIVFRVLNFCMLIAVGVYAYKKYAHKMVTDGIADKNRLMDGLHQEQEALNRYLQKLNGTISDQHDAYGFLEEKIARWSESLSRQADARLLEKNKVIDALKRQNMRRTQYVERQVIAQKVMTTALEKTEDKLIHALSGRAGQQYVGRIVEHFKKTSAQEKSNS